MNEILIAYGVVAGYVFSLLSCVAVLHYYRYPCKPHIMDLVVLIGASTLWPISFALLIFRLSEEI